MIELIERLITAQETRFAAMLAEQETRFVTLMKEFALEQETRAREQETRFAALLKTSTSNFRPAQQSYAEAANKPLITNITYERSRAKQSNFATEDEKRAEKLNNLVLINWPELDPPLSVTEEQRADDQVNRELAIIRKLLADQGGEPQDVEEVFRMGVVKKDRARPLKVKLSNQQSKKSLRESGSKLVIPNIDEKKQPFFRHDLTEMQRENRWIAQQVVQNMRIEEPDYDYVLRDKDTSATLEIHSRARGMGARYRFWVDPFDEQVLNDYYFYWKHQATATPKNHKTQHTTQQ